MKQPIITLTTDFGTSDGFIGAMKGVILGICPQARIMDITHDIGPQDVMEAALILDGVVPYYPAGAIHVVVVDPGVGSARKALALIAPDFVLVGPDNGVFSPIWAHAKKRWPAAELQAVELSESSYHLDQVSTTFHGRDIFAPVAAHLAAGVEPEKMGPFLDQVVTLDLPEPRLEQDVIHGEIIHVDSFGNCITNIPLNMLNELGPPESLTAEIGVERLEPVCRTYSDVEEGRPLALVGSFGKLEASLRNGSLARTRGYGRGTKVRVLPTRA